MSVNKRTFWRQSLTDITYCSSPGTSVAVWALTNNPLIFGQYSIIIVRNVTYTQIRVGSWILPRGSRNSEELKMSFLRLAQYCLFDDFAFSRLHRTHPFKNYVVFCWILNWFDLSPFFCHFHPLEYWSCLFCFICFTFTVYVLADVIGAFQCMREKTGANVPFTV